MKKAKLFLITICAAAITNNINAQSFEQGTMVTTLGYGFPSFGKAWLNTVDETTYGNYNATGFGPLHFRFEYGVLDKLGVGLNVNFNTFGHEFDYETYDNNFDPITYTYSEKITAVNFIVHVKGHWVTNDKLDLYSGIGFGYSIWNYTSDSNDPYYNFDSFSSPIVVGIDITGIGLRYYFTDNIGAYAEVGYAKSIMQVGVAAKF